MDNVISALNYLQPADMDYDAWLRVGMALKNEGYPLSAWDDWSRNDSRYQAGVCEKKWESFENGMPNGVTGGTIVQMAKEAGWQRAANDGAFSWNSVIEYDGNEKPEKKEESCEGLSGVEQLKRYLQAIFQPEDIIGYCTTDVWKNDEGRYMPSKGVYTRSVSELLASLEKYPDDLGFTVGNWKKDCGAWIRFNPLDGKGIKNENVTAYRYALVESDDMPLETQEAFYRASELPIAALVYSGGKSMHAIVHIDAQSYEQYSERVNRLYNWLAANGMSVDKANRNPSRLSRMPGVTRNGKMQKLCAVNIGCKSWEDWCRLAEKTDTEQPQNLHSLTYYMANKPPVPEELIHNVLRCGHKMLISGSSKAGKSFLLMELCIALSEGLTWLSFPCKKSKVLYVNLEIDPASCVDRFLKIYDALNITPQHTDDLEIWNLRGHAAPLDELAPKIIDYISGKGFDAVVIDPIYKVITGDENNASEMGYFCNQFDKICAKTGAAVIYCHHHSKGSQGFKKAQDRASGSGVFARDPDAQLDMIQLELTDHLRDWVAERGATAWRLEGSLREFPKFRPVNFWFNYPIHVVDQENLSHSPAEGTPEAGRIKNGKVKDEQTIREELESAYDILISFDKSAILTVKDLAEYFEITERAVRDRLKKFPDEFEVDKGIVTRKELSEKDENDDEYGDDYFERPYDYDYVS